MAKMKLRNGKQPNKSADNSSQKIEKKLKRKRKIPKQVPVSSDSDSDSDPQTKIQTLLEPLSKDQLITFTTDLCLSNNSLFALFKSAADKDVSHRKFFVHGLGWDATRESVEPIFAVFGEIEDLNVVTDRATGKCKGYAFITFKNRNSAKKLLRNPKVTVGNRVASCQLASEGSPAPGVVSHQNFPSGSSSDYSQRKIYVNNVPVYASVDRLRSFFETFGEIESGPTGLDSTTGKFKGYAIFVFKTVEGAKKVLEEPYKFFEGNQLNCQKAAEGKKSVGGAASITTAFQPVQPQMLAAMAVAQQAQNMALLGQQAGLDNPLYGGGMIPSADLGALMGSYYGMMGSQVQGTGLGAYGVSGVGAGSGGSSGAMLQGLQYMYPRSGLGAYGVSGVGAGSGGSSGAMLQGLQYMYPRTQLGQSSSLSKASGTSGTCYSSSL